MMIPIPMKPLSSLLVAVALLLAARGAAADSVSCNIRVPAAPAPKAAPPSADAAAASDAGAPAAESAPPGDDTLFAQFDFDSMNGEIALEIAGKSRRFHVKATPSGNTYLLVFEGYAKHDQHVPKEKLVKDKSVVARLVAYGEINHLFLDADYNAGLKVPADGFVCH